MLNKKIALAQGDVRPIEVNVVDAARQPVSLAGVSARWVMTRDRASENALVTKTTGSGIEILDAAAGRLRIRLEAADTKQSAGDYYHQLRLTMPNGDVVTPIMAYLTILEAFDT